MPIEYIVDIKRIYAADDVEVILNKTVIPQMGRKKSRKS